MILQGGKDQGVNGDEEHSSLETDMMRVPKAMSERVGVDGNIGV